MLGGRAVVAAAVLMIVASCSGGSSDSGGNDPTASTTTPPITNERPATISDISDGSGAYEIATHSAGVPPMLPLVAPAPVGSVEQHWVTVRHSDSQGRSQEVSAKAQVEVINSIANGDGTWLRYTLGVPRSLDADSADQADLASGLALMEGVMSNFWLDQNRVGVSRTIDALPVKLSSLHRDLALDLLEAPLTLALPIPNGPLGAGATWSGRTRDASAFALEYEGEILTNDESGFTLRIVVAADLDDGRTLAGVLEIGGRPGTVLPARSTLTVDLSDGAQTVIDMECIESC